MQFYLGTHETNWLERTDIPLFVSHRRLAMRKRLPVARGIWSLDSGGFTELSLYGGWQTSERDYLAAVRRYRDEIGGMQWAAPMDWMCEPWVIAKTGLSVEEHQARTVRNFVSLREAAPELPLIPVLQGWEHDDYLRCVEQYDRAGVDLRKEPLVGLGTVCRRQSTGAIEVIVERLTDLGIRLHGFGVKTLGLARYADLLTSADSLAWSYRARRSPALPGCTHNNCNSCLRFAARWYQRTVARLESIQTRFAYA